MLMPTLLISLHLLLAPLLLWDRILLLFGFLRQLLIYNPVLLPALIEQHGHLLLLLLLRLLDVAAQSHDKSAVNCSTLL